MLWHFHHMSRSLEFHSVERETHHSPNRQNVQIRCESDGQFFSKVSWNARVSWAERLTMVSASSVGWISYITPLLLLYSCLFQLQITSQFKNSASSIYERIKSPLLNCSNQQLLFDVLCFYHQSLHYLNICLSFQ